METKVKSREWVKTAAIIFLAVLLVLTFFSNTIMNASLPEVAAQQVTSGTINARIRGSGTLSANETYDVTISQTRKVASVKIREGQTVNAGDVLFVLEAEESEEVQQAQDQLDQMELNYEKSLISAGNESARENREVQKAQEAYNEALAIYNQYSNMEPTKLVTAQAQADAKLKELQKIYQKAQEELAEVENDPEYTQMQADLDAAKEDEKELQNKVAELEQKLSGGIIENKDAAIKKAREELSELYDEKHALEITYNINNLETQVEAAEKELSQAENDQNYLLFLNNVSNGDEVLMRNYREDKQLLIQKLIFGGYAAMDRAESLADDLMSAYDAIDVKRVALENLQNELAKGNEAIAQTISDIANKEAEIAALEQGQIEYYNQAETKNALRLANAALKSKINEIAGYENSIEAHKETIKRIKALVEDAKDQMDAQQDVVDSLSNASNAAATVKSCKEQLEDLIFQQGLGDGSYLDLQAAKEEIEKQKEKIEKLMENADEQEVTAKVGGVISAISVTAGNTVGAETPMATINLVDRGYTIKIPVTTEQSKKVKIGDKAELLNYWGGDVEAVLEAFANDPSNPGKGKLLVFRLTGDVEPNQNYTLSIGQKSAKFDCLVPNAAIRNDSNGSFVLALVAKSTPLSTRYIATRVDVQIQANDDTYSAVTGLTGGDFVITTSTKPIEPGTQVRLVDNG